MTKFLMPTSFSSWDAREYEAIYRVVKSGQLTMAGETEAFEHEFAEYHGRKHCICVNSGSSANMVALEALFNLGGKSALKRGDTVAVPAFAWGTTWSPLLIRGMELVLADADETWNARRPHERPSPPLGVAVPILGNPAHLPEWEKFEHTIVDACESLGAKINGRHVGSYGDMATCSFYWSHQLGAIEGGAILCDSDELDGLCRMLRDHGMTRYRKPELFEKEYEFAVAGYNVRPAEINMAVARVQLGKLDALVKERRANAALFDEMTADLQREKKIVRPRMGGEPSPFCLNFTVHTWGHRSELATALRANGIDCRLPTGGSLKQHPIGATGHIQIQKTPAADDIHWAGIFLGLPPHPAEELIASAVKVLKETL